MATTDFAELFAIVAIMGHIALEGRARSITLDGGRFRLAGFCF